MYHGFASRIRDAPKPLPLFLQKSDDAHPPPPPPPPPRKAFRGNPKEMAGLNNPWRCLGGVSDLPFAGTFRRPRLGGPPSLKMDNSLGAWKDSSSQDNYIYIIIYIYNPRSCDCLILDGGKYLLYPLLFSCLQKNFQHIFQPLTSLPIPAMILPEKAQQPRFIVSSTPPGATPMPWRPHWCGLGASKSVAPMAFFERDHRPRFWNYPLVN